MTALCVTAAVIAKPVSLDRATAIAHRFFPGCDMRIVDYGELYLFTPARGTGFVIVAADDCVRPVLAYSSTTSFPAAGMPAHVENWIDGYRREIASLVSAGASPSAEVQAMWNEGLPKAKSGTIVPPLLTTTWNQAPLYNALCPYDEQDSAYSVTGCVATATAQIMKYWNHPAVGAGSHGYNHPVYGYLYAQFDTTHYRWSLMPDALTSLSDSTGIMAVAELMYHVGVAVNMSYSPSASGAQVNAYGYAGYPSAETALKTYFKYNPMLYSIYKSEHSDTEWDAMIAAEIEASRPVLYAGFDSTAGHAFVLDGFDSLGMFHVNWGWGGAYDGYYTTDSLSPGAGGIGGNATYTFNRNNSAVIGISPLSTTNDSSAVVDMRFDPEQGSVDGNGTYTPLVDEITIVARAVEGYRFLQWSNGSTENPLHFLASGDISDSAIFIPIAASDTAGYCNNALHSAWHDDYSDTTEWGIRIPSRMRHSHRNLVAVQYVPFQEGDMTLNIYVGDSIDEANPVYTAHLENYESYMIQQWNTHQLEQPLRLADNAVVWVTLRVVGDGYPASISRYCGNSDGLWYRLPEGWSPYDRHDVYFTAMIRAVMEPTPVFHIAATPNDITMGNVEGMGDFYQGDTCTLFAIATSPYHFTGWSNGEQTNPLRFAVTSDSVFVAFFSANEGIDPVEGLPLAACTDGLTLTVTNPEGRQVALYDVMGRLLTAFRDTHLSLDLPAAGVYLLQAAGLPARRIVAIK